MHAEIEVGCLHVSKRSCYLSLAHNLGRWTKTSGKQNKELQTPPRAYTYIKEEWSKDRVVRFIREVTLTTKHQFGPNVALDYTSTDCGDFEPATTVSQWISTTPYPMDRRFMFEHPAQTSMSALNSNVTTPATSLEYVLALTCVPMHTVHT